ncbi:MAG: phosphate acyltransferase PlsX [bacterium]
MRIAVDAMGGDKAPDIVIEGAILAAREYPVDIALVGPREIIEKHLSKRKTGDLKLDIIHASQAIYMDEHPTDAVRKKKDSSMHVSARLIKSGEVDAMVTAGNTAAALAITRSILGKLKGVSRPAIAAVIPNTIDATILLDVGANAGSCGPLHLLEFALMGTIYSKALMHKENPRVGLLSVGEEKTKGSVITLNAFPLLEQAPINFIGNVEGKDIVNGSADIVVCDGFVGNAILKFAEGASDLFFEIIKAEIKKSIKAQIGMLLAKSAFKAFSNRLDYEKYGGAPILGINGACIIGHGRSTPLAIKEAIRVSSEFVTYKVNSNIEDDLRSVKKKILSNIKVDKEVSI